MSNPIRNFSTESNTDWNDDSKKPSWAYDESERRTFSRKRSLECSSIEIRITNTELIQNHTVYVLTICCGMRSWIIKRRYKDFDYLDRQLKKQFPSLSLPALPPKRYLRSSSDPEIVDERKQQLENYLNQLVGIQQVWARNDFVLFLNDESNLMTFIWSFERMRRLQDMLRATQMENQDEKSQLNQDLQFAEKQVVELQEKLSQMEMLFLQQAAGMAKEQLPNSLIRSISGVQQTSQLSAQLQAELTQKERDSLYGGEDTVTGKTTVELGRDSDEQSIDNPRRDRLRRKSESSVTTSGGESLEDGENNSDIRRSDGTGEDEDEIQPEDVMKAITMVRDSGSTANNGLIRPTTPDERRVTAVTFEIQEALRISQELFDHTSSANLVHSSSTPSFVSATTSAINTTDLIFGKVNSSAVETNSTTLNLSSEKLRDSIKLSPTKFVISTAEEMLNQYVPTGSEGESEMHGNWVEILIQQMSNIEEALIPTASSLQNRFDVFLYVRELICRTLGVPLFPIGSTISHTFLRDSDLNCTAFISTKTPLVDDTWYVKVNEALCLSAFQQQSSSGADGGDVACSLGPIVVSNVSFVNRELKMIRSIINGITVDIAMNQYQSLFMETIIERVNSFVQKSNLFKRSLLLLKAWFQYESSKYTYGGGSLTNTNTSTNTSNGLKYVENNTAISTWSIVIMLIATFQHHGNEIHYPIQALGYFFRFMTDFDWMHSALTIFGSIAISSLDGHKAISCCGEGYFPAALFKFPTIDDQLQANKQHFIARQQHQMTSVSGDETVENSHNADISSGDVNAEVFDAGDPKIVDNGVEERPLCSTSSPAASVYVVGILNLIDPLSHIDLEPIPSSGSNSYSTNRPLSNLFGTMNKGSAENFLEALHTGYKHYQTLCESCSKVLSFGAFSGETVGKEVYKYVKEYFFNICYHYSLTETQLYSSIVSNTHNDRFLVNAQDLNFARNYSEMILGGRIDNELLSQLVLLILEKKGSMPVGEIGKNLQALLGCELLSKRLKEQFSGLKKAIEHSNTKRLVVGTEHPFNPIVKFTDEENVAEKEGGDSPIPWSCDNLTYLYTSHQVLLQLQGTGTTIGTAGHPNSHYGVATGNVNNGGNNIRDNCSIASGGTSSYRGGFGGNNYRHSYRRPPPMIMESGSYVSQMGIAANNYSMSEDYHHYTNKRGGSGSGNANYRGSNKGMNNGMYMNNSPNRSVGGNNNITNSGSAPPNPPNSPYYLHQLPPGAIPIPSPHGYPMEMLPPGVTLAGSPVGLYPAAYPPMFSSSPVQIPFMPHPYFPHPNAMYPPPLPPQQHNSSSIPNNTDHSS